jgi:hypothetical protein
MRLIQTHLLVFCRVGAPQPRPYFAQASSLVCGRSGLVDPLDAVRRGRRTQLDRRPNVVKLEVLSIPSDLDDVYDVLDVAGVGHPLRIHCLVGVVARLGDVEGLIYVPALGLLLDVLLDPVADVEEVVVEVLEVTDEVVIKVLAELIEVTDKVSVEVLAEVVPLAKVDKRLRRSGGGGSRHYGHYQGDYPKHQLKASHENITSYTLGGGAIVAELLLPLLLVTL